MILGAFVGCSGGTEADQLGVAATCESDNDCATILVDGAETQLTCLTQFSAGYCAIEDCDEKSDCPQGSTCVAHDDGNNYCFRECADKSDCNANRPDYSEANCSASFDYASPADEVKGLKACIPPSSGE